jgi:hypothetical protein
LLDDRAQHDGHTGFEKIAAHKGNHGNEKADALAKAGSQQPCNQPEMCEGDFQVLDEDAQPIAGRKGTRKLLAMGYKALRAKAADHWMLKLLDLSFDPIASHRYMSDKSLTPGAHSKYSKCDTPPTQCRHGSPESGLRKQHSALSEDKARKL